MTDRVHSLTVVLEQEYRDDDVRSIITAINALRGVISVRPNIADMNHYQAKEMAKFELRQKLYEVLR